MNEWIDSRVQLPTKGQEVWLRKANVEYKAIFLWVGKHNHPVWRATAPTLGDGQLLVAHAKWAPVSPAL